MALSASGTPSRFADFYSPAPQPFGGLSRKSPKGFPHFRDIFKERRGLSRAIPRLRSGNKVAFAAGQLGTLGVTEPTTYFGSVTIMGMFQVKVRVSNSGDSTRFFEESFWVDTGALYSFVPEDRLHEIGVQPLRTRELILADGRRNRRLLGEAVLTIPQLNESLTCPLIFAPKDSLYLLGATALENFGVQADPTTQQLIPIAAVIGGFLGSAPVNADLFPRT